MKSKNTIAGLGSGKADELTLGVLKALEEAEQGDSAHRPARHCIFLKENGITFDTLDDIYEKSEALTASILR